MTEQTNEINNQEINKPQMREINYDIYNALNLVNEELGKLYEDTGYNPFDSNFELDKDYILERFANNKNKQPILTEEFLEKPTKEISKSFKIALENTKKIKDLLENNLKDKIFDKEVDKEIRKTVVFLKNREQMINKALTKLKDKNANALKLYQDITDIDKKLSEIMKESFYEEFTLERVHQNFVSLSIMRVNKEMQSQKTQQQQMSEQQIQHQEQNNIKVHIQETQTKEIEKSKQKEQTTQRNMNQTMDL